MAESLYWMSRYLERAQHTARLIDVDLQLRLDQSLESSTGRWLRLVEALHVPALLAGNVDATRLAHTLTFNRTNPSSIVSCIASARENLRHVREQSSSEMWEQLNRLYLQMTGSPAEDEWVLRSHILFRAVQDGAHLFQGITDSTMSHGEGWQYIQLGRFVERTDAVAALVATHFSRLSHPANQPVEGADYLDWVGLLKCCAAFEAYCKAYSAELRPIRVAEFLLLNSEFPHSIRFSVESVHAGLGRIGELTERKVTQPVRIAGRMRAALSFSQIEEIMAEGVHLYMENIRGQCTQAHAAIQQIYFDYPVESALAS
ncbi:MAG TPA: alpha-E domain-containing protein [Terriglobales bacterium]|nr:alpha-E domain-containing protein [Terriglobales bacterium]